MTTIPVSRGCFTILVVLFGFVGFSLLAKGQTGPGVLALICTGIGVLRLMYEKN
jgi:hypothetical protein